MPNFQTRAGLQCVLSVAWVITHTEQNYHPNIEINVIIVSKGAWEVDQQRIISGAKQCSRHLNKKIGLPISLFLEQAKKNIVQIPKNITHFINRHGVACAVL